MNTHSGLSRALSVLLSVAMLFGLLSVGALGAFAEGEAGESAAEKPYIVLSDCDSEAGWNISGNVKKGLDTEDKKQGAASLVAAGGGEGATNVNFMAMNAFNTPIPADWDEVFLEFWLYISDVEKTEKFVIEISQTIDKGEYQWAKTNGQLPGLHSGWNKMKLSMGSGANLTADKDDPSKEFKTVKNIRIFETAAKEGLVLKIDDICLSKGGVAEDTAALDAQLEAAAAFTDEELAEFDAENVAVFKAALTRAEEVKAQLETEDKPTQRDVDAAAEYLASTVAKLNYDAGVSEKTLLLHGRTYYQNKALMLYWTNSGFTFNFEGTGATAHMTASSIAENVRGYVNVYVDGALTPTKTICLDKADGDYVLAEGLEAGKHTIEVRKRNEANYGGSATIGVSEIAIADGEFLAPPEAPERRIEVIGDSITSGFGNLITNGQGNYTSSTVEGTMTYAALTGKAFGAEANILSRSGIRFVYSNPELDKVDSWYQHYGNTATLPNDNRCNDPWDFEAKPNDVVIVNLGTNDNGARYQNGTSISDADVQKDAAAFLELIREKNPDALIVWTYGIMGSGRVEAIKAAIAQLNAAGDENIYFLPLDRISPPTEETGLGNHPTVATSINRSFDLVKFIAEKTGWDYHFDAQVATQIAMVSEYTDEVLADYTEASAKALKDAVAAAKALTDEATDEETLAAIKAIQVAKVGLILAGVDYSYGSVDVSTGEVVGHNAEIVGLGNAVTLGNAPGETKAYALPNQNQGFGVKVDPRVFAADNQNITIQIEYYMDSEITQANTRLNLTYKNAAGQDVRVTLRQQALDGFVGAEVDKWATWELKLTDAAFGDQTVANSANFSLIKWGYGNEQSDGKDIIYIRSIKVMSTPAELDTAALEAKIAEAEKLDADLYTEKSFEALETALTEAKAVLAEPKSQKAIDDALTALNEALDGLEELQPTIDREMLEAAIEEIETLLNPADFTKESFAALQTAVDAAKKVLENAEATDEEIAEAYAALEEALENLVVVLPKTGDIDRNGVVNTTDARLALQYAVEKIELDETQLLLGDVDGDGVVNTTDARLILQYAVEKIDVFPADIVTAENLQMAIEQAEALLPQMDGVYTEESIAAVTEAIEAAKKVVADEEAVNDDRLNAMLNLTLSLVFLEPLEQPEV